MITPRQHRLDAAFAIVQCSCGTSYDGKTTEVALAKLEAHLVEVEERGGRRGNPRPGVL